MQNSDKTSGRLSREIKGIEGKKVTVFSLGHLVDQGRTQKRIKLVRERPLPEMLPFFHMGQDKMVKRRLIGVQNVHRHQKKQTQEEHASLFHRFSRSAG